MAQRRLIAVGFLLCRATFLWPFYYVTFSCVKKLRSGDDRCNLWILVQCCTLFVYPLCEFFRIKSGLYSCIPDFTMHPRHVSIHNAVAIVICYILLLRTLSGVSSAALGLFNSRWLVLNTTIKSLRARL